MYCNGLKLGYVNWMPQIPELQCALAGQAETTYNPENSDRQFCQFTLPTTDLTLERTSPVFEHVIIILSLFIIFS